MTAIVPICAMAATCSNNDENCACPCVCFVVQPQFSCTPTETPTLSLSGPCQQNGYSVQDNGVEIPGIGGTGAGTCHATFMVAGGASYSTDIAFAEQWYPCGSDPHGCGHDFESDASTWMIENACADAGSDAPPDVAPDGARE